MSRSALLGIEGGHFQYGSKSVFSSITFQLDRARTALVGENGAGKSTLLQCLSGQLELDSGKIVRSRDLKIGFVAQETSAGPAEQTVRDVLEQYLPVEFPENAWKVDIALEEIGVLAEIAEQPFAFLSGGWRRLINIVGVALLSEPDIMILDEPTNHLDLSNINMLERWIVSSDLPMLIVSHDREFLERTTARTIFLRSDGAHYYNASFGAAREQLMQDDATDAVRRQLEGKEIERLEAMAARYRVWGIRNDKFGRRAKATDKRIERMEGDRTTTYVARDRKIALQNGEIDAKVVLRFENCRVETRDQTRVLFEIERLVVRNGDRIAILGANGSGKTTFLNLINESYIAKQTSHDSRGQIRFNPQVRLAYFDQKAADVKVGASVFDFAAGAEGATTKEVTSLLVKSGFSFDRVHSLVKDLSYGERARLMLVSLQLQRPNFYLLDEPTNHMDIEGQEELESRLENSDLACIFVSHDRFFLRDAATRFFEIKGRRLVEVEGPDEFFEQQ